MASYYHWRVYGGIGRCIPATCETGSHYLWRKSNGYRRHHACTSLGLLITGAGVLIIFAAFNPPLRAPMMVLGVVEKIVLAGSILATPLRKRPIPAAIAALDLLIALLYILYMIAG
jgi:hypothetical protein